MGAQTCLIRLFKGTVVRTACSNQAGRQADRQGRKDLSLRSMLHAEQIVRDSLISSIAIFPLNMAYIVDKNFRFL